MTVETHRSVVLAAHVVRLIGKHYVMVSSYDVNHCSNYGNALPVVGRTERETVCNISIIYARNTEDLTWIVFKACPR